MTTNNPYDSSSGNLHDGPDSKSDVAKQQASEVGGHAADAGKDLARTAQVEAKGVARDAQGELRSLFDTSMNEVSSQARNGQNQLAASIRTVADELDEMATGNENAGTASRVAREVSGYGQQAAQWLETHEPTDALDEVRRFASRRPMLFLGIAAGAGLLVGRFARGMQAERSDQQDQDRYGQVSQGQRYAPSHAMGQGYAPQAGGQQYASGQQLTQGQQYVPGQSHQTGQAYQTGQTSTGLPGDAR